MLAILRNRLAQMVPVAFVSTIVVFLIIRIAPGDPAQALAGPDASNAVVQAVRVQLGLNRPLYRQYISWLGGLFHGHLGRSYLSALPVTDLLAPRIVATSELILAATAVSVVAGIALGSVAGLRPRGIVDSAVSWLTGIMVATPEFWVGLLAVLLFSVHFGWLPPEGHVSFTRAPGAAVKSLVLPALTLAFQPTAVIARSVAASVTETLQEDFVRTARAKGAGWSRLYFRHILRNALVPILAIVGLVLTRMLGGAIVIESVFAWPGVGLLLVSSLADRDYQVVQATLLLFVFAVIIVNLVTDLLYAVVDPRIRVHVSGDGLEV
jgi:peptide/nickel transport system permease protein